MALSRPYRPFRPYPGLSTPPQPLVTERPRDIAPPYDPQAFAAARAEWTAKVIPHFAPRAAVTHAVDLAYDALGPILVSGPVGAAVKRG